MQRRRKMRQNRNLLKVKRFKFAKTPQSLKATIKLIGDGIKDATGFVPMRQYAGSVASLAPARDFLSQLGELYDDITENKWRYVFDPVGIELVALTGPRIMDSVLGFGVPKPGRGFGDCDEATSAMAGAAQSIGLPATMITIAGPVSNALWDHIFPQIWLPDKKKWMTADPVVYPRHRLGWTAPHSRFARWDLNGTLLEFGGSFPGPLKRAFRQMVQYQPRR